MSVTPSVPPDPATTCRMAAARSMDCTLPGTPLDARASGGRVAVPPLCDIVGRRAPSPTPAPTYGGAPGATPRHAGRREELSDDRSTPAGTRTARPGLGRPRLRAVRGA